MYICKTKNKMNTPKKHKVGGIISASEILKAGGPDNWAKKTGYDSSKIKMSGIIQLTDEEFLKNKRFAP